MHANSRQNFASHFFQDDILFISCLFLRRVLAPLSLTFFNVRSCMMHRKERNQFGTVEGSSVYSRYRVNNLAQKFSSTFYFFFYIYFFFNENVSFNGISKSLASKFSASGKLPVLLKCRFPGKWFTIENITKLNSEGGWDNVKAAKSVAVAQCKRSRTASSGGGAQCTVTGTLPEIQEADVVKVDYFCWEIG